MFFILNRALLHFWFELTNSNPKLVLVCHPKKHMLGANLPCRAEVCQGKFSAGKVAGDTTVLFGRLSTRVCIGAECWNGNGN